MVLQFLRDQYLWILKICKIEFGGEPNLDGMKLGVSEDFHSIGEVQTLKVNLIFR